MEKTEKKSKNAVYEVKPALELAQNLKNLHADNLEYVTSKQNKIHAVKFGLKKSGEKHHNTKTIIMEKDGQSIRLNGTLEISKKGFHPPSVNRAARGERKGYKGWNVCYA